MVESPSSNKEYDLPKINIPSFIGNYKDWPAFKDLFESTINSRKSLTNTQKFHFLKSSLRDEALNTIRHIPVTDTAYSVTWKRLKDRYDRPKQILHSFLETFMSLPKTAVEDVSILRRISDGANEVIGGLSTLSNSGRDCWLIYLLLEKIDSESKRIWIRDSQDINFPSIERFLKFLDNRCDTLELSNHYKQVNVKGKSNTPKSHAAAFISQDTQVRNCVMCNANDHTISKCSKFMALSIDDRSNFIRTKSLCFNCLKVGHTSYNCSSKYRCKEVGCNKRHHTLVHFTPNISMTMQAGNSQAEPALNSASLAQSIPWSTNCVARPTINTLDSSPIKTGRATRLFQSYLRH